MSNLNRATEMASNDNSLQRRIVQSLAVLCVCGWLAACDNQGPAERAGERIDEFATDAGNAVEDKCEEIKEGAGAEDTDC